MTAAVTGFVPLAASAAGTVPRASRPERRSRFSVDLVTRRDLERAVDVTATPGLRPSTHLQGDVEEGIPLHTRSILITSVSTMFGMLPVALERAIGLERLSPVAFGGAYRLAATSAQPDVGHSSGASLSLQRGYWHDDSPGRLFRDGFESGSTGYWSAVVGLGP